jgi:hypothetical protein
VKAVRRLVALSLAGLAASAPPGAAGPAASPSVVAPLPVQLLTATASRTAFVADAPSELACARIVLWAPQARRQTTFNSREQCRELASTGQGVASLALASSRLLWVTFAGGNTREWSLWTATTTRRMPRRLRFAARDVDAPAPIVLGPGSALGVAYAVDREVVYLGDDGRRIFAWTSPDAIRAVAAGPGPNGWRIAAIRADGTVVALDAHGKPVLVAAYPPEDVRELRLSVDGVLVQIGPTVDVVRPAGDIRSLVLPPAARMADAIHGRILWTRAGDLGVTSIATRASRRLVDGSPSRAVLGQLEPRGLAWARGRVVHWRPGPLP